MLASPQVLLSHRDKVWYITDGIFYISIIGMKKRMLSRLHNTLSQRSQFKIIVMLGTIIEPSKKKSEVQNIKSRMP